MFKKVLGYIVAIVGLAIVIVLVMAAMKPSAFKVQREADIAAPPATVFALINDFHAWPGWSPWEKLDPNMKRTLDGPPAGEGATYAWAGNEKAGEGKMTITESVPDAHVGLKLDFIKPFASSNQVDFTLEPKGGGTHVTWAMTGNNNFTIKVFTVFMNMDEMIGADFDAGLANLKTLAEQQAPADAAADTTAAQPS
jgi:uncharacterized protein YndB with AHSA1/START domain